MAWSLGWTQVLKHRFSMRMMEGYKEAKSKVEMRRWKPGVGSSTVAPV